MQEQINQLQDQLNELKTWKESLERSSTIPISIDNSFGERFGKLQGSIKTTASETVAIDEGGFATHSVLNAPDAFIQTTINERLYYIPVFT